MEQKIITESAFLSSCPAAIPNFISEASLEAAEWIVAWLLGQVLDPEPPLPEAAHGLNALGLGGSTTIQVGDLK